jgi:hypothetical protein
MLMSSPCCVYPPIIASQRLCEHLPAAKNRPATVEEMTDVVFLCGSC